MILYFASNYRYSKLLAEQGIKNILISFYHFDNRIFEVIEKYNLNVFLDSGGFSIMNSGAVINVEDYCDFLDKYHHYFKVYANLDCFDTEKTLYNQQYLEEHGFKPIPVYHYFEYKNKDYKDLIEEYCKKYDYVALGGLALKDVSAEKKLIYLKYCMDIAKKYNTKTHGFAITSSRFLNLFNFYSADSFSWLYGAVVGMLFNFTNSKLHSLPKEITKRIHKRKSNNDLLINHWNIYQWKKYAEYLEGRKWIEK